MILENLYQVLWPGFCIDAEVWIILNLSNPLIYWMTVIKRLVFLAMSLWFVSAPLYGQFGVRASAVSFSTTVPGNDVFVPHDVDDLGWEAGIHYWLRLSDLRIEFFPELFYSSFDHKESDPNSFLFRRYGLALPVRVYPLDFKSDCQCPTFSKQNDFFKKGFFIQVSPTFQKYRPKISDGTYDLFGMLRGEWQSTIGLGLGGGIDIGISDLLTLSPTFSYYLYPWENVDYQPFVKNEAQLSLTVTFRPDYH